MAPKGDTKVDGAGRMVVLNTDSSQVEFGRVPLRGVNPETRMP